MMFRKSRLIVSLLIIGLAGASAMAQESRRERRRPDTNQTPRGDRGDRGPGAARPGDRGDRGPGAGRFGDRGDRGPGAARPGDGGGPQGGWFGRGGPPREPTPEDRERFYDGMIERYMERYSERYELTDEQKQQVRQRLDELKTKQREYTEQHWQDFQALRQEMWQMRESGQFNEERGRELRQRFEALRQESPLFNDDRVADQVEQMLPADQVERGRARRQIEEAEREQRRQEWRQRWEERRREREQEGEAGPGRPDGGAPSWGPPPGEGDGQDGSRRRWGRGFDGRRGEDRWRGGEGRTRGEGQNIVTERTERTAGAIPENPVGPWEQYVRDFINKFQLDAAQQATAQSVLREVLSRRTSYEQAHRHDYEQARELADSAAREKKLAELNRPVVSMFEELKNRLNRIPSSKQRQLAGVGATSRPAGEAADFATSQPARDSQTGDVQARPAGDETRESGTTDTGRSSRRSLRRSRAE
ncbi:MAG TPA: hypothetical protein PLQ89_07265 [Phycisphaerae bacterium]|nr:hypothetical protein [Phycisphaerae bacterium]HOQ85503.1 hypothetical protein [Phycisphaerae bacterium]